VPEDWRRANVTPIFKKAVLRIRDVYPGIPDPDFYPSRIPDLRSRIQKQVEKRE
jgi:hypothetical protein